MSAPAILIPAYKPGKPLVDLVTALRSRSLQPIVVVNDGSGPDFDWVFEAIAGPETHVLKHAVNLGKGAALKTGFNYVLCHFAECGGVVTVDADGQHDPEDVVRIAQRLEHEPACLVLGVRQFDARVPLRSRIGNTITCKVMNLLTGQRLADTQTGLRGIPRDLLPHLLRVTTAGYEFETDMLMACKYQQRRIVEEPIQTIYVDQNRSSHFNPISDSMRIYFVLLRFGMLAVLTALIDNLVFILVFQAGGKIAEAQVFGRLLAMAFNYAGARAAVFHSRQQHREVLPKYLLLVLTNAVISYALIVFLNNHFEVAVLPAKMLAEMGLFVANFAIQRDFVFVRRRNEARATDWDQYYKSVPPTAQLTRRYTSAVLLRWIHRCISGQIAPGVSIIEIGGANSCFMDRILAEIRPDAYHIFDTNRYGLKLVRDRVGNAKTHTSIYLHEQSVLNLGVNPLADLVFSVGLVEHFDPESTRNAVLAHFDLLKPGGHAIITFPTPTPLYRAIRFLLESLGIWKFHDERALQPEEVAEAVRQRAEVVHQELLWPLLLTQTMIVARKPA